MSAKKQRVEAVSTEHPEDNIQELSVRIGMYAAALKPSEASYSDLDGATRKAHTLRDLGG